MSADALADCCASAVGRIRERIDAEADRHLAALYAEPGSAPEQGTM